MTSAKNGNYTPCVTRPIKYLVLHYTAGKGDTAAGNIAYFQNNVVYASAHYFVDRNGWEQSVDDNDIAWAVGTAGVYHQKHSDCNNYNSISVEMCCNFDGYTISPYTIRNAAILCYRLMIRYDIPITNVLRHWDVVDKECPKPWVDMPELFENFKRKLNYMVGEELWKIIKNYLEAQPAPDWAKDELNKAISAGITDGSNPNGLIPRYQAAIMAYRAANHL